MAKETKSTIQQRLREALDARQMRASELVERSGVPKSAVSFYLAGKSKPKADRLYILAQVLDVDEAWLLGYDVPMNRSVEARKNDQLATLVSKMRKDPDFFEVVSLLAGLDGTDYASIKHLLLALGKK